MQSDNLDYPLYEKVATDAGGNILFSFIGAGIVWGLSKISLGVARGTFWLACVIMVISTLHFFFVMGMGLVSARKTTKWVWAAHAARALELILCLGALWIAAKVVGYA